MGKYLLQRNRHYPQVTSVTLDPIAAPRPRQMRMPTGGSRALQSVRAVGAGVRPIDRNELPSIAGHRVPLLFNDARGDRAATTCDGVQGTPCAGLRPGAPKTGWRRIFRPLQEVAQATALPLRNNCVK